MESIPSGDSVAPRPARALAAGIKQSLRDLRIQLSLLNQRVSARVDLRNIDLDCLDLIALHGPLSPSALARRAALHPATVTGILDRLERAGWVVRERDPADRRAVVVKPLATRAREVIQLYAGMDGALDEILTSYGQTELAAIADFLSRAAAAGRHATDELGDSDAPRPST